MSGFIQTPTNSLAQYATTAAMDSYVAASIDAYFSSSVNFGGNVIVSGQIANAQDSYVSVAYYSDGYDAYCDLNTSNSFTINLGTALSTTVKIYLQNPLTSGSYVLKILQHATTNQAVSWSPVPKWPNSAAPIITTAANATDIISLFFDGTNYFGSYVQNMG